MDDEFLLRLYRLARETSTGEFESSTIALLKTQVDFHAAVWGDGRVAPESGGIVARCAHVDDLDPGFLKGWHERNDKDPMIPWVRANPGRSIAANVDRFYAAAPDHVATGRRYGISSLIVTSEFDEDRLGVRWLSLYRDQADAQEKRTDTRRIEFLMPHLCEAWRIHRAVHFGKPWFESTDAQFAVADRQSGILIRAENRFCNVMTNEWSAFDGKKLPSLLCAMIKAEPQFVYRGRTCEVSGVCAGELILVRTRSTCSRHPLTRRQLEIAELYSKGFTYKEIALQFSVSPATVRNHLAAIYQALGAHSRRELASALQNVAS